MTATSAPASTRGRFGLPSASALVVGSVIGTGVFALPSALAAYGPISLVAFGLVTVGAIALALTFRSLNARLPGSGGPYVYARDASSAGGCSTGTASAGPRSPTTSSPRRPATSSSRPRTECTRSRPSSSRASPAEMTTDA
jgi:hypothetical protein